MARNRRLRASVEEEGLIVMPHVPFTPYVKRFEIEQIVKTACAISRELGVDASAWSGGPARQVRGSR